MLSNHEAILLEIMSRGEDMLPIGAHEAPLQALAGRGLVCWVGNAYRITPAGVAAFEAFEDAEFARVLTLRREVSGPVVEGVAEECPP